MELSPEERKRIVDRELARFNAERRAKRTRRTKRLALACLSCLGLVLIVGVAAVLLTHVYPVGGTIARATIAPYPSYTPLPTCTPYPTAKLGDALRQTATPYPTHPTPTYTASPVVSGIDVSRADIRLVFERDLGYRFEPEDFFWGQPFLWGMPADYSLADLRLFGPPEELVAADIIVALPKDDPTERILNVRRMMTLLKAVAPGWEGGSAWVEDNLLIATTTGEVETFYGDLRIRLNCSILGVIALSFDAKGAAFW